MVPLLVPPRGLEPDPGPHVREAGIRSDARCISCTQCSKYCQVGVDVMYFAKNQEFLDNSNSACIQCGICVDVCPMGVLSFDLSTSSRTETHGSDALVEDPAEGTAA